ncbi:MAG: cysteine desulfurase family protein [Gammaproteobacteria bacterium]|nr:cysteine desulfurase family protein [Gammaproteobacteria bacterium]
MKKPIYLDYAATTPMCLPALEALYQCLGAKAAFGNPHSTTHLYGFEAKQIVEESAELLASLIHAQPQELIWTSGATESNNLAIQGAAQFYAPKGRHLITCATEHHAVLDVFRALEKQGFSISILPVDASGLIDLNQLQASLTPETSLVSIMMVNNELGTIQPMDKIAEIVKANGSLLHVDAAQALGKLPIDLTHLAVDMMSFSGHKVYGPKGIGALYVRSNPKVHLQPLWHGGGQQWGLRPGTEAPGLISAFAKAAQFCIENQDTHILHVQQLHTLFCQHLQSIPGVRFNTDIAHAVPHIVNVCFEKIDSETFLLALQDEIAISQGSACASGTTNVSHVLKAIGLKHLQADRSFRFSFSHLTTLSDLIHVNALVNKHLQYSDPKGVHHCEDE